jgi:transcriptional regulator with XRE-family HTH domain
VPRKRFVPKKEKSRVVRQIGRQVRALRLDLAWSHEKLAEAAKMNPKYLGRLELGQQEPGADILFKLARALGVPVGALFETAVAPEKASPRLSHSDVKEISETLAKLTTLVDRIASGLPRPLPPRAPRGPRRPRR